MKANRLWFIGLILVIVFQSGSEILAVASPFLQAQSSMGDGHASLLPRQYFYTFEDRIQQDLITRVRWVNTANHWGAAAVTTPRIYVARVLHFMFTSGGTIFGRESSSEEYDSCSEAVWSPSKPVLWVVVLVLALLGLLSVAGVTAAILIRRNKPSVTRMALIGGGLGALLLLTLITLDLNIVTIRGDQSNSVTTVAETESPSRTLVSEIPGNSGEDSSPTHAVSTPIVSSSPTAAKSPTSDTLVQCSDAPNQGLRAGDTVYVCTQSDRLVLRSQAGFDSSELLLINPGTSLYIVAGPVCADGWLWWEARTAAGDQGWVAEGRDEVDDHFICRTPPCEQITGPFRAAWSGVSQKIGCPLDPHFRGWVAEEHFEGGIMFWREDLDHARSPVLFNNGTWRYYTHTPFEEGSPLFSCIDVDTPAECPPTPIRGFGIMWCDIPELRKRLGRALECERGYEANMQLFANGFILRNDQGVTYVLHADGMWERR